jgi:transcription termination factor Rho
MSVLERDALESSPLADLHAIASELGIDGYRRLRKADLIDALLQRAGGGGEETEAGQEAGRPEAEVQERAEDGRAAEGERGGTADVERAGEGDSATETRGRRRGRRGGRTRASRTEEPAEAADEAEPHEPEEPSHPEAADTEADGRIVVGVVELIPGGSGFVRVDPGEVSDDDVYISAAQVKRCELVNGDRVSGPRRAARRSERYPSLIRIDTINGRPATEIADGSRYDDLPAAFPSTALPFAGDDPSVRAVAALTPFGRGSRVTIAGPSRSGKSRLLRALADALAVGAEGTDVEILVALAGVRPEEITEWQAGSLHPAAATNFAASAEVHDQTVELVTDQAKRIAARGRDAVVLLDTLDALHPHVARKLLAAARQIVDGGSLTLIATASEPVGGETTVIALDYGRASVGEFPALDLDASGTLRVELLVGEEQTAAILGARAPHAAGSLHLAGPPPIAPPFPGGPVAPYTG